MDAKEFLQGLIDSSRRGGAGTAGAKRPGAVRVDGAQRAGTRREIASPTGEANNFTGVMKQVLTSRPAGGAPETAGPEGVPAAGGARRSGGASAVERMADGTVEAGAARSAPAERVEREADAQEIVGESSSATAVLDAQEAPAIEGAEGVSEAEPVVSEEEVLEELESLFGKLREFLTLQISGQLGPQSQAVLASLQQSFSSLSPGAMQALQAAAAGAGAGQAGITGQIALLASQVLEMLGLALAHVGTAPHGDALSTLASRVLGDTEADADWASLFADDGGAIPQGTRVELPVSSGPGAVPLVVTVQGAAAPGAQASQTVENPLGGASARSGEGMTEGQIAKEAAGVRPAERILPEVVERIVRAAHVTLREGSSEMRLRLNPPQLGSLRVDLRVTDGVLTGRLQTESAAAQMAVSSQIEQLKSTLAEQGIAVGALEVTLSPDARASAESEGSGERRGADGAPREGGAAEGTDGAPSDWREERLRFGLSRFERVG